MPLPLFCFRAAKCSALSPHKIALTSASWTSLLQSFPASRFNRIACRSFPKPSISAVLHNASARSFSWGRHEPLRFQRLDFPCQPPNLSVEIAFQNHLFHLPPQLVHLSRHKNLGGGYLHHLRIVLVQLFDPETDQRRNPD